MRVPFGKRKRSKETSTRVMPWCGVGTLFQKGNTWRKKNIWDEREKSLVSNGVEKNDLNHDESNNDKSSASSSDNSTAHTNKSSSFGSLHPMEIVDVDPAPAAANLLDTKTSDLQQNHNIETPAHPVPAAANLLGTKTSNLRQTHNIETPAPSKRKTKSSRRKRRLMPVWGLHWESPSMGLKGKYTGSSVISLENKVIAHGHGTLRFTNGDVYVGPFYYGEMHGNNAKYYYHPSKSSGRKKYYGSFVHNKKRRRSGKVIYDSSRVAMDIPMDNCDGDCSIDSTQVDDEDEGVSMYDSSKQNKSVAKTKPTKQLSFLPLMTEGKHLDMVPENSEEHC